MSDKPTRKLHIIGCEEVYRGQGAKGEYVIYEVGATTESGEAIDQPLRAFERLPTGPGEFTVTPYDGKNGRTWTVAPVRHGGGSPGARLGPKVDELRGRVEHLETQVAHLQTEIQRLNALAGAPAPQAPAPAPQTGGARFGDEPPF